jgi:hypothetical protein
MVQFQVNDSYSWDNTIRAATPMCLPSSRWFPLNLPWKKVPVLITRTTLPYVTTPDLGSPINDRKRGFGDAELLLLATPKLKTKGVQIGIGVNAVFPTAGDNNFTGSGKWQIGPAALYINMQTPKLQWGLFAFQDWSFASSSSGSGRPGVSKLSLQPFITKHFDKGWYIGSPESPQEYNWNTKKWTWKLGPSAGRVFKIGKQPVKMYGALYYNPEDDAGATAKWTGKMGITFLFPK